MYKMRQFYELSFYAMISIATAATSIFIKVTEEMLEGSTHQIDHMIIMWMRASGNGNDPLGPIWLEDFARDVTALGSPVVLGLFVFISSTFLHLINRRRLSFFMLTVAVGGTLIVTLLKEAFARPRPEFAPENLLVYTASFPSGHAMISAVVYLTLGVLIARIMPNVRLKLYAVTISILITGIVGISRVYLGAHWPSDVLAGWAIGAAWASACGVMAQTLNLDKAR